MAKKQENVQAETSAPEQTQQAPSLTLQDLVFVAQLVQLTTQRGAFRAEELQQVGEFYNKVVTFLEASGAITRPAQETTND